MKKAAYYEEAKRLYVQEGYSLETIEKLLKKQISRRTMFNWKQENAWDDQRKKFTESQAGMQDELMELARAAIKEAKASPTSYNIFAVAKALSALKMLQSVKIDESVDTPEKKKISDKTIEAIDELLGIERGQTMSNNK